MPARIGRTLLKQWFMVAMLLLLGLAWWMPAFPETLNKAAWPQKAAIILIFFISGLCLKPEEAIRGLAKWRLHLFIQLTSFVFFPILAWILMQTVGANLPEGLRVGIFILAVLPTTISSCVILTQMAGGDFAAALFNSVAGNVAGVFLSPLLLILLVGAAASSLKIDPWPVFFDLSKTVIVPLFVGQICHQLARQAAERFRKKGMLLNNLCILFIIYLAFGKTFNSPAFQEQAARFLVPLALIIPAHWVILGLIAGTVRLMGWNRADRVTAVICASQKTLALGLPMAAVLLKTRPDIVGLASLPIIVYHPTQLLTAALLAHRR